MGRRSWQPPKKPNVFVSYHHGGDFDYYDALKRAFADQWNVIRDHSCDRDIDSTQSDYVMRTLREDYVTGSSCTIVLCGAQTHERKFVDWEIKATLDKKHGLIGVRLPTNPLRPGNTYWVPGRLHDNVQSGYAIWISWQALTISPAQFSAYVQEASNRSVSLIQNARAMKARNG